MKRFAASLSIVAASGVLAAQERLNTSTKAVVAAASAYVTNYQSQLRFVVADEAYTQEVTRDRGPTERREMTGELFLVYLPGDHEWIAVHDVAEVDGRKVVDRDGLRGLLQQGEVSRVAALVANRNAAFNIGRISRNFNEPTLPLLLLGPQRVGSVSFDRRRVDRTEDSARVTLSFTDRGRPTLIRSARGGQINSTGEIVVDAASGRVERTLLRLENGDIEAALSTEYALDTKLELWVPSVFRETYSGRVDGVREVITCEARYTNYRTIRGDGPRQVTGPAPRRTTERRSWRTRRRTTRAPRRSERSEP